MSARRLAVFDFGSGDRRAPAPRRAMRGGARSAASRSLMLGALLVCDGLWSGLGGAARAADPKGAPLFKALGCPACHGEDGSHPVIPEYPVIAGQNAPYLLRQMQDIRDGRRANGLSETMRAAVGTVTDAQFEALADWLSTRW